MSLSLILFSLAIGQPSCPGGHCPVAPPNPVAWHSRADEPGRVYLFVDGRQRGGYDGELDEWRDYDPARDTWGQPRSLFPDRPARTAVAETANFGVMVDRLGGVDRLSLSGKPVSADAARQALNGPSDDSQALRLTVIGPEANRKAVVDDLAHHPALASVRERVLVQSYEPNHWAVAGLGFVRTGRPTIYLQAPDGRVLHRQDEYRGPEKLAEAVRRADPNYRPDQDPDLNVSPSWPRLSTIPRWAWAAASLLFVLLISRRRTP